MESTRTVTVNDTKTFLQTLAVVLLLSLLALTSAGTIGPMLPATLVAMFLMFIWFLADRKAWLASITAIVFVVTVLLTAKALF